jgi:hypothetical protein
MMRKYHVRFGGGWLENAYSAEIEQPIRLKSSNASGENEHVIR